MDCFSKEMKQYLRNSSNEYDYFYHIRSITKKFYEAKPSKWVTYMQNYIQTFNNLSFKSSKDIFILLKVCL